jgi:hypothetical protein
MKVIKSYRVSLEGYEYAIALLLNARVAPVACRGRISRPPVVWGNKVSRLRGDALRCSRDVMTGGGGV